MAGCLVDQKYLKVIYSTIIQWNTHLLYRLFWCQHPYLWDNKVWCYYVYPSKIVSIWVFLISNLTHIQMRFSSIIFENSLSYQVWLSKEHLIFLKSAKVNVIFKTNDNLISHLWILPIHNVSFFVIQMRLSTVCKYGDQALFLRIL